MRRRLGILILVLAAAGCRGPRPRVVSWEHRPRAGGGSTIEVVVENTGKGEGQIEIEGTLRSGDTVVRVEREVTIHAHERVRVALPFEEVPADGSYHAEVAARYPVD